MPPSAKRIVLVTGGSRGIGREICMAFAASATHVYFNYSSATEAARETEALVKRAGRRATGIQADVAAEKSVAAFIKQVVEAEGQIDVLVNNAGVTRDGLVVRMKESDWDTVLDVNLKGAFFCIKAVAKQMMKQRYGRIINLSSVVGAAGNPGQANYVAAKAGIIGLTKSVARELATRNITVNAVAPGFIETDMTRDLPEKATAAMLQTIPMGRPGLPAEIAETVVFLASDSAAYITGQTIHVSGGMYM